MAHTFDQQWDDLPTVKLPPVPSIRFTGRIYPVQIKVTFRTELAAKLGIPPVGDPYEGLDGTFRFNIKDSEVEVSCYLNRVVQSDLPLGAC
jgi:hypothetical protein